jgi:pyruvate/2-oxoglutarate dehydrogenase complex dihydrolipoamide dehydrogenase (E3) component
MSDAGTLPRDTIDRAATMDEHTLAALDLAPADEHNRRLVEHVHPPGWENPVPRGRYNLVVIGAGTAGLVAAAGAGGLGAKVALVERHLMGGDCLNVGCVPSKAIIRSGRAAFDVRDADRFGVRTTGVVDVDFARVMERVRKVRADIAPHDSARRFADTYGVDVYFGGARFTGRDTLEVDGRELEFARAVIATGARAAIPPIPGLADAGYLTHHTLFNLTEPPRRLAVIGGGPIGCELAQTFARLGTEVALVETMDRVLPREDPDAADLLRASLERDGVRVRLGTALTRVEGRAGAKVLHLAGASGEETLVADELLLAVGRVPNVEGLGLETAGVEYGRSGVTVDDTLRTTNRRIYASGDVCLDAKFTHVADAASRAVLQNALFPGPAKRISRLVIPRCIYTDPEIAHVGLSAGDAADRGIEVETWDVAMNDVDRALAEGDGEGFLRVWTKAGTDEIVGATIVARHAGEMISEITTAMVTGLGLGGFARVIHPYPTRTEAIRKAADAFNRTRLTPVTTRLLDLWFRWRR